MLFRQNYMTSVLAVRQKEWMVFFIGTGDGQLIKVYMYKSKYTVCSIFFIKSYTSLQKVYAGGLFYLITSSDSDGWYVFSF